MHNLLGGRVISIAFYEISRKENRMLYKVIHDLLYTVMYLMDETRRTPEEDKELKHNLEVLIDDLEDIGFHIKKYS